MRGACDLARGGGVVELHTPRLKLRQWREEDLDPWAQLNADPEVMRYFPSTLSRTESDALAEHCRQQIDERGWGLWAVEIVAGGGAVVSGGTSERDTGFIGWVGLAMPSFDAHFTPAVEVGWRLTRSAWGRGYAPEAAEAAVTFGFSQLGLDQIVSFTAEINGPSRRVMEKLGMRHNPADDFDHPRLAGQRICHHVLYRVDRSEWGRAG